MIIILFRKLVTYSDMHYENVMVLKNVIILSGGIIIGSIVTLFLLAWITRQTVSDRGMTGVEILRIKKGSKYVFVMNPQKIFDVIHSVFLIIGWKLCLVRKNNVFYHKSKVSKYLGIAIILIGLLIGIFCMIWTFTVVHVDGRWY